MATNLDFLRAWAFPFGCTELREKTLGRVLPNWDLDPLEVHALYASVKMVRPAARALTDLLIDNFRRSQGPSGATLAANQTFLSNA
jgi:hypothetical protein